MQAQFAHNRALEAIGRMKPDGVVELVDVVSDDAPSMLDVSEDATLDALVFERREEALGDGVVPAVALATDAADEAILVELGDVAARAVGAPAVGVMQDARWRIALSDALRSAESARLVSLFSLSSQPTTRLA
jgi:hypothetical protein